MSITIEADKAFFWSDLHLFHKAAAKARGKSVEDMNRELVRQIHHTVPAEATLFLLGDVSFGKFEETRALLSMIACRKVLVLGNHDKGLAKRLEDLFDEVHKVLTVKVVEYVPPTGRKEKLARIICSHYPIFSWEDMHHGTWHLHGHCHGSLLWPGMMPGKVVDVGVDADGLNGPMSFYDVKRIMDTRSIISYDHHKPNMAEKGDWTL